MPRVVLLGTGTSVGKTFVAAGLARALARLEPAVPVLPLKPVETGIDASSDGAPPPGSDAALLEGATHLCTPPRPHPIVALPLPVSPNRAAKVAGRTLTVPGIVSATLQALHDATLHYSRAWHLVETAGGAFSPLSPTAANDDLAAALDPAVWILVAPDALGVIHDVVATITALRLRRRAPDILVLTAARSKDASTGSNANELRSLGIALPILGVGQDDACPAHLAHAVIDAASRA